jgi:hypothetical protein
LDWRFGFILTYEAVEPVSNISSYLSSFSSSLIGIYQTGGSAGLMSGDFLRTEQLAV